MKTAAEYTESIKAIRFKAYALGERVGCACTHPLVVPSLNAVAMTYKIAEHGWGDGIAVAMSHLTGKRINRFTHIHQNRDDLVSKVKMLRILGQKTGTCFQRCVGMDALNALSSTTFEMDMALGTEYHRRFTEFLKHVQNEDLVCDGAMTDPKGDRGKRPNQQDDKDLYLRVVESRADGIVVRGAKCHQTGALNAHEIIVMPSMSLRAEDADYAVSFAVPSDSKGITHILGRQASDTRKMEGGDIDPGNSRFGGHECLIVFEDVFVPWDRVFMYREFEYAGVLVERFASYHRQSYGGCKVGVGDVLIGAVANLLDYHGISGASHARAKLVEMVHLNETLYACGLACSSEGRPTASGTYEVEPMLANVCKLNVTRNPYEIARLAEDLVGGLMVTMPSEKDMKNPETSGLIEKYLKGASGVRTECRLRMLRLVENMTIGSGAVAYRTESMHGAGSPEAMKIMIARYMDLSYKKRLARDLAGVPDSGGEGGITCGL